MSAIELGPEAGPDLESDDAQRYFEQLEAAFARLRGSPLLLSAQDREVAVGWFRRGIPVDFIEPILAELFAKRRERDPLSRLNSLRYSRRFVDRSWSELEALNAAGRVASAPALSIKPRLERLAELLPATLPEREHWQHRIRALDGSSQKVEEELGQLDNDLLTALEAHLDADQRARLDQGFAATLVQLATRLPTAELEAARAQLFRRALRKLHGLPVLSLFSAELEADSG